MVRLVSLSSVLAVVALGPQAVLGSFSFKLSPVVQCEPVNLTFSGTSSHNHSVPTTLTILPLVDNAPPIKIPIPNGASNTTGIQLSFIPLPSDTQFIASLDNIQGSKTSVKVSDVNRVGAPSDPSLLNDDCLGSPSIPHVNAYTFDDVVNQCETFTVTYNTTFAPEVTGFIPKGGSFLVLQNDSNPTPGIATFVMNAPRNTQLALFFDDGEGNLQTTKLMTVGGDTSSSDDCIMKSMVMMDSPKESLAQKPSGVPKAAIIGITVGAIAVVLLIVLILLFVLRQRRRNRRASDMRFDPAMLNKRWSPSDVEKKVDLVQSPPTTSYLTGEFVRDPVYTNEKYAASIVSDARTSIGSWNQFIPQEQQRAVPVSQTAFVPSTTLLSPKQARRPSVTSSRISMATVDIQNILQMATVHRDGSSQGRPSPRTPTFDINRPPAARQRGDPVSRNNSAAAAAMSGVPSPYANPPYVSAFDDTDDEEAPQPLAPNRRPRSRDEGGIGGYPVPRQPRSPESFGNLNVR